MPKRRHNRTASLFNQTESNQIKPNHTDKTVQGYRDAVLIDADLFFGMVFCAERFRPYLGKLFLASAIGGWVGGWVSMSVVATAAAAVGATVEGDDNLGCVGLLGDAGHRPASHLARSAHSPHH